MLLDADSASIPFWSIHYIMVYGRGMARPRAFDHDQVLESARQVFWRHGLHATSVEDLSRATGLGQSSLYNAFGSKDKLFAACLDTYLANAQRRDSELLEDTSAGVVERVEALLNTIATEEAERTASGDPRGCLAVNTLAELADDPEAAVTVARITKDTATRLALLADVLRLGQASGEVTTEVSADGLAAYLNAAIAGVRISSQGGASRETIAEIITTALRAIRPA